MYYDTIMYIITANYLLLVQTITIFQWYSTSGSGPFKLTYTHTHTHTKKTGWS